MESGVKLHASVIGIAFIIGSVIMNLMSNLSDRDFQFETLLLLTIGLGYIFSIIALKLINIIPKLKSKNSPKLHAFIIGIVFIVWSFIVKSAFEALVNDIYLNEIFLMAIGVGYIFSTLVLKLIDIIHKKRKNAIR